jgi:apolipoprotein N-acyltransferase
VEKNTNTATGPDLVAASARVTGGNRRNDSRGLLPRLGLGAMVAALTAILLVAAFPPGRFPEAAYIFAVPGLLWSRGRPEWHHFLGFLFGGLFVGWVVLIWWLHHVTWVGMIGLSAFVAFYPLVWFAAARVAMPRLASLAVTIRIVVVLGLAGFWIILEWVRMYLFTGFPWLPLAASQWERPILLQSAAFTGAWGISFILIFFNLGLALYLVRLVDFVRKRGSRFCPEFYLALIFLFLGSFGLFRTTAGQKREPLMRAGVNQPYIPQVIKWDPSEAKNILNTIYQTTLNLKGLEPTIMFWPEAVTPLAVMGNTSMQEWVEMVSRDLEAPIVMGGIAFKEDDEVGGAWYNAVYLVKPETGLSPHFYAKRHLVPFGEYIPFRRYLPWVVKFVPIGGDFVPSDSSGLLSVNIPERTLSLGPLICYEDLYPSLARRTTTDGAALLFVATNNAWYGEGAAAYQHAAHSVLRAVENRRPILRTGNGGWSGWIDEYGLIRNVLVNDEGTIYFRGGSVFELDRDRRWIGRLSFYTRHGDWFVLLSLVLALIGTGQLVRRPYNSVAQSLRS